ncbi:VanZ family protein [Cellulomonas alba]|uniref:VanZ family protein n=1 Tax=Cellulomonas alba TaxID=3053467 RepID=A0ABT7SGY4_9CELL|nr:VanZ family protein [Cellulomonas alba]MDM7855435.1 VanZ family protein [Cellulomonas alba]
MTQLWRAFGDLVPIALVVGGVVGVGVFLGSWAHRGLERSRAAVGTAVVDALLAIWGLCYLAVTLAPAAGAEDSTVQLVPLRDLDDYAHAVSWQVPVAQVGGNLVLYGALGVLLAARWRWGVPRTVAVGALIAVVDEGLQWLLGTGRSVTTDDVIVGAVGVAIGATVVVLARSVLAWAARRRAAAGVPVAAGAGQRWR